jgi:hypothetical protein
MSFNEPPRLCIDHVAPGWIEPLHGDIGQRDQAGPKQWEPGEPGPRSIAEFDALSRQQGDYDPSNREPEADKLAPNVHPTQGPWQKDQIERDDSNQRSLLWREWRPLRRWPRSGKHSYERQACGS